MLTDLITKNLSIIFCGINPGLKSAWDGHHFSGRSNRFWKVLHQAGFTPHQIEPVDDATILDFGYGLTTAVVNLSFIIRNYIRLFYCSKEVKISHLQNKYSRFTAIHTTPKYNRLPFPNLVLRK